MKKIFIGAAWPYVNGNLHLGHLAGYLIPADTFSRFCRILGLETLMVSGTDCHGTPITIEADKEKVRPKDIVAKYTPKINELLSFYNLTFDIFTSTTTENHKKITQKFFLRLLRNGYILKKRTLQYYSEEEKKFLPDRYVRGKCSICFTEDQRGDQCEKCGKVLNPGELIEPRSILTGRPVILKETEHYFLDYPQLQDKIEYYVRRSNHWRRFVYEETISWLSKGLEPRAITRDLDWGVEIPDWDIPESLRLDNSEHKRFYVWFDAVIGYFSGTVEWAQKNNRDWREFWQNEECFHYYFMGKDNLVFHTIFWPGQILGQHLNLNLPYFPAVNNFLFLEGQKFSKSRGIIIDSLEIGKNYSPDYVRFYLNLILPEEKDTDFKWRDFENRINGDLVNNFGNFFQRVLVFYRDKLNLKIKKEIDNEIKEKIEMTYEEIRKRMFKVEIVSSFNLILDLIKEGNRYLDKKEPWKNREIADRVIYNSLLLIFNLRKLINPFLPQTSRIISEKLSLEEIKYEVGKDNYLFEVLEPEKIRPVNLEPIFKKIKV